MRILLPTVLWALLSCAGPGRDEVLPLRELHFRAYTDAALAFRTTLGADGCSVLWAASDEISVFDRTTGSNSRFVNGAPAGQRALFSGIAPMDERYFALYPYQADAAVEDDGQTLVATLPESQAACSGSFGPGANLSVAYAQREGDLYFRNIGALLSLRFTTSHAIRQICISAAGSPMSGRVCVMMDDALTPSVEAYGQTADHVTLEGDFTAGATYYAVVLPGSYRALRVCFTDEAGATATFSNPVPLSLDRNESVHLGDFAIPESKWVSPPAQEYVQVAQDYEDWSGTYLIVAPGTQSYAASGAMDGKWLSPKPVTVSDGKIVRDETNCEYEATLIPVDGTDAYAIRFANGNYLGSTNSNDGIKVTTQAPYAVDKDFLWTFAYEDGLVKIALKQYPTRILRLNGTSGFRTYTSSTGTQATLFRGGAGDGVGEQPAITASGVLSRNTTSAYLVASFRSGAVEPASGGFRYGTSETLGQTAFSTEVSGTSGMFSVELSGLQEGALYYYEPFIVVDGVTYTGTRKSFRTQSAAAGVGGRGWYELPAQQDADGNGIDDANSDYYYSWTMMPAPHVGRNFSACYSKSKRHPIWVAAPMHVSYKGSSGRTEAYANDPAIACEQSTQYAGYTRGHMLGSSDRTLSRAVNAQVFYYSNIGAQLQTGFNTGGGAWNNLESLVDDQWCADTLYQVIGCLFETFTDHYGVTTYEQTGLNGAGHSFQVPTAWYKVLLRTKSGSSGKRVDECTSEELKCVGFILSHRSNQKHTPCAQDLYSVSEIEALTGLTFFVNVPNAPKDTFKASDWGL